LMILLRGEVFRKFGRFAKTSLNSAEETFFLTRTTVRLRQGIAI
jgi:hypothetical protein